MPKQVGLVRTFKKLNDNQTYIIIQFLKNRPNPTHLGVRPLQSYEGVYGNIHESLGYMEAIFKSKKHRFSQLLCIKHIRSRNIEVTIKRSAKTVVLPFVMVIKCSEREILKPI